MHYAVGSCSSAKNINADHLRVDCDIAEADASCISVGVSTEDPSGNPRPNGIKHGSAM